MPRDDLVRETGRRSSNLPVPQLSWGPQNPEALRTHFHGKSFQVLRPLSLPLKLLDVRVTPAGSTAFRQPQAVGLGHTHWASPDFRWSLGPRKTASFHVAAPPSLFTALPPEPQDCSSHTS